MKQPFWIFFCSQKVAIGKQEKKEILQQFCTHSHLLRLQFLKQCDLNPWTGQILNHGLWMFKIKGKKTTVWETLHCRWSVYEVDHRMQLHFFGFLRFFGWQSFLFDPMESVRCKAVIILIGRYGLDDHLNEFQWIFAGMIWTNGKGDGRLHSYCLLDQRASCHVSLTQFNGWSLVQTILMVRILAAQRSCF